MTPYVARRISPQDLQLFARIERAVHSMPDLNLGRDEDGGPITLSCHMLARAVADVFPVLTQDGRYAGLYDHSWNITLNGSLIDPYPVGAIGGPIMLEVGRFSPARHLYKPMSARKVSRGRFSEYSFCRSVRRIATALSQQDKEK